MRLGTQIELPDGRIGTVVYNSLIGVGIKWGRHDPNPADFAGSDGNTLNGEAPDDWGWEPEAILRDPWDGCERHGFLPEDCVGRDFKVIQEVAR